ncbi:MAG TPA: class I SAM-dependent methyltransferase [Acidobacteriaceae bacterium]|nr:class I SAM-dependent methyltransferase [Acidobacteriaceae bacterium]
MNPAARIVGLYEENAALWDRLRNPGRLFEKPWLDRFLALIPPGGTILDLGCGPANPIASYFIRSGYAVTGVDSSPSMIALCQSRHPEGEWRVADMRTLDLGRRFDAILAWDSFFHLNHHDQRGMFPIFARHAAPGTALMFTGGPAHGEVLGEFADEPLYHSSLDPEEYRSRLADAGFSIVASVLGDPECGDHCIWLAQSPGQVLV